MTPFFSIYSAADVFVAPSVQENLSNTVMETVSCGLPCVAFDIGGMPDLIEHQRSGYLAAAEDAADLARGIAWVLDSTARRELAVAARSKAERSFSHPVIVQRHLDLYRELLQTRGD